MFRLALAALVFSFAACTATPPAAPEAPASNRVEAALPSVPGDAEVVAVAQPVAPTGDDELDAFLAGFAAAVDRHDWRGVAARAEGRALDAVFGTALAAGDAPQDAAARAVARVLGLSALASGPAPFDRLDAVRVVTLRSAAAMNDMAGVTYVVEGDLRVEGGASMPLTMYVGRGGLGGLAYAAVLPERSGTAR